MTPPDPVVVAPPLCPVCEEVVDQDNSPHCELCQASCHLRCGRFVKEPEAVFFICEPCADEDANLARRYGVNPKDFL